MVPEAVWRRRLRPRPGAWRWLLVLGLTLAVGLLHSRASPAELPPELPPTPQWLPFALHDAEDGLPSSQVSALAQDAGGWLWVGTSEGLARWDGMRFEAFRPAEGMVLPVAVLRRSEDDALWIAVEGDGLWRLAPDRRSWQHYHRDAPPPRRLPSDEVFALHEQAGALWVGFYGAGLARIRDGSVETLPAYPVAPEWSPTLLLGRDGELLAGTVSAGLQRLDLADGRPTLLATGRVMHAGLAEADAFRVAPSRQELIEWRADGLRRISLPRLDTIVPPSFAMARRADGLWLATDRGLLRRGDSGWQWFAAGAQRGLPDGRVMDLLVDREQNLWVAVEGQGLVRIDPPGAAQTVWLGGTARRAAAADRSADGSLLIVFRDGGLARIDPEGTLSWVGPADAGEPFAILEQGGSWWLGHAEGLSRTPIGDRGGWQTLHEIRGATELVDLLIPFADGGVVASLYGSAVFLLDAEGQVRARWAAGEAFAGPAVEDVRMDAAGGLWIAHARGVCRIAEPAAGGACTAVPALEGERVNALTAHGERFLALTGTEIVELSIDGESLGEQSLPMLDGARPSGLHVSPDGRRWLATSRGLLRLEPDGRHAWEGVAQGWPTGELADRPFRVRGGELLVGSERGLVVRQLDAPPAARLPPGEWRLDLGGDSERRHWRHGEPRPTLRLHARQLASAGHAEYRYRLDGPLPREGLQRGALRLDLALLPAGEWQLEVHSPAAAAPWRDQFTLAPPWWETPLFRVVALLVGAAGLALAARVWRRRWMLEQRLRLERAQAEWGERLAAEKTEFVATLSHELRNQLQGLSASLALVRVSGAAALPAALARTEAAVAAMAGLLNDALELSRLESGRLPLRPTVVPLARLQQDLADALATLAGQRPAVACEFDADLPPLQIEIDPLRFRQIVLNLAGNGLRHAATRLAVALTWNEAQTPSLQLWVRDDGPGIPAELRERLFGRWQRAREAGGEGSGLGLAICRQLVERMDGSIAVESEPGATCFRVELPVRIVDAPATQPLRVLLVLGEVPIGAGDPGVRLMACATPLALLGCLEAHPGAAGVLVLPDRLDAIRPLLPVLRQRAPGLRVLLLGTSAMPADLARAREQGLDGLLGLPLDFAALQAAIDRPA